MEESKKQEKVRLLADMIQMMLEYVDNMTFMLTSNDLVLLEDARSKLAEKINHNNAALPVIMALGGNYNDTEDKLKIATLDSIVLLIKSRIDYRETMIKQKSQKAVNEDILRAMGVM